MKILVLADEPEKTLWEFLDRRKLENVDLILSCGDLPSSYLSFLTCFSNAPILYVHGNHDDIYDHAPPEGCICIEDQLYVFRGVRILGLGGSMRYNLGKNQYTEHEMARRIRRVRPALRRNHGFDILLAHSPAEGLGDDTDRAHTGFSCFLRLMEEFHPAFMLHGHVHRNYQFNFKKERAFQDTRVINAYKYTYIELPDPPLPPPARGLSALISRFSRYEGP